MTPDSPLDKQMTRRGVLGSMAAAGAAVVVGCDDEGAPATTETPAATDGAAATSPAAGATPTPAPEELSCIVSPEQTEGPFFVDTMLERADIREDREGVPLELGIRVFSVENGACAPLTGAVVDIWHCDADGAYSGVAANGTDGQQFLRGLQRTDENGAVTFTTIYPGWYTGRAVHIHAKVRTDPDADQGYEFTSQLYFDDSLSDEVFAQTPYNTRGERDTRNDNDGIYADVGAQMTLAFSPDGDGYAGTFDIGVQV